MNNIQPAEEVTVLEQIAQCFLQQSENYGNRYTVLKKKIASRRKTLERLEAQMDELIYPAWKEWLLQPVLKVINDALPDWWCEVNKPIPGLSTKQITVFFERIKLIGDEDRFSILNSICITFLPGDLAKGELLYMTDDPQNETPGDPDTHAITIKPLQTIAEAIGFLKRQIRNETEIAIPITEMKK